MKKLTWLELFLAALIMMAISASISLLDPAFYGRDSIVMATKASALDLLNLALVLPLGLLSYILAKAKQWHSAKLWAMGILAYMLYMYAFNALSLYFNALFLVYNLIAACCVFGLILGYSELRVSGHYNRNSISMIGSAIYLLLFASIASIAWIIEIVSSTLNNTTPESIAGTQLPVGVVHVLDLTFTLPVIIIACIMLFLRQRNGLVLCTLLSPFVALICIAILWMELALLNAGEHFDPGQLYSMYLLVPLSVLPNIALFRAKRALVTDHSPKTASV